MLLETPAVPRADDVGDDALAAAKPLLLLGWADVACLAARVAVERRVRAAIDRRQRRRLNRSTQGHPRFYELSRAVHRSGLAKYEWVQRATTLHSRLSMIAHGDGVTVRDAVRLIDSADDVLAELIV